MVKRTIDNISDELTSETGQMGSIHSAKGNQTVAKKAYINLWRTLRAVISGCQYYILDSLNSNMVLN